MKNYDVIILGAGASGLMCAGNISPKKKVAIVDGNAQVARKVKISGGGKCNITNISVSEKNYDGDKELIKTIFKGFNQTKLLRFLERNKVALELRKGQYYFCQEDAQTLIDVLMKHTKHTEFFLSNSIVNVSKQGEVFRVQTDKVILYASKLVVATGGCSFAQVGATDIGLHVAKEFGIEYKPFTPALVGLTLQKEQFWMKELSGLSCFVALHVNNKVLEEEMLFAHKGLSGPVILSASLYWEKGEMAIDFLPQQKINELTQGKKMLSSAIPLPKRLAKAILKALHVEDVECFKLTKEQRKKLQAIHKYIFAPAGNFGFRKAEVSKGGVCANELEYKTLKVKKVKGLHFIGEVVDVTGELGGYNFQWAFSSGYMCAKSL